MAPASNGCITAECAAGLANSDYRDKPNVIVQGGFHVPISPGVLVGANGMLNLSAGTKSVAPDIGVGGLFDIGANIGFFGDPKYTGPTTINIGLGKYAGVQLYPTNSLALGDKPWYFPSRYLNGVSAGIGAGIALPVSVTADPTYTTPKR
jgi:filamentous hemagglutinin